MIQTQENLPPGIEVKIHGKAQMKSISKLSIETRLILENGESFSYFFRLKSSEGKQSFWLFEQVCYDGFHFIFG